MVRLKLESICYLMKKKKKNCQHVDLFGQQMTLKSEILSISALFGVDFSLFVDTYCLRISIHDKYENCRKQVGFMIPKILVNMTSANYP